jgi:Zn-dependent protease
VLLGLGIGLGWGRPVYLRTDRLRVPAPLGGPLVALAGPLTYAALVGIGVAGLRALGAGPYTVTAAWPDIEGWLVLSAQSAARINLGLALFHLLPLFPLDGYFVIHHLLPLPVMARWEALAGRTTLLLGIGVVILLLTPLPVWEAWIVPPLQRITAALLGW